MKHIKNFGRTAWNRIKGVPWVGWFILLELISLGLLLGDNRSEVLGLYGTAHRRISTSPSQMSDGMVRRIDAAFNDPTDWPAWLAVTNLYMRPRTRDLKKLNDLATARPGNGLIQCALAVRFMEAYFSETSEKKSVTAEALIQVLKDCEERDNENALFPAFQSIIYIKVALEYHKKKGRRVSKKIQRKSRPGLGGS